MKKTLSLLACIILVMVSQAIAENGVYRWKDWRWKITYGNRSEIVEYVGTDKHVKLPENINGYPVSSIAKFTFSNCEGIESITVSQYISKIDDYAFSDMRDLKAIYVSAGNQAYESIEGVLFDRRTSTLVHYPSAAPTPRYIVPEGTKTIGVNAFWVCANLEELVLPASLISMEDASITWCELIKTVDIPYGVETLGVETLAYCSQLEVIYLPKTVKDIGLFSFASCAENLKLVVCEGSYAEEYARKSQRAYVYESEYSSTERDSENISTSSANLSVKNCADLATILSIKDSYDYRYAIFATNYKGQVIEFDGRIDYVTKHGNYNTRYDILVSAGDFDPNHQIGPVFKFEDVAAYSLGLDTLFLEDEIWVGRNVHIVAEVDSYNVFSELFYLQPISVTGR